MANDDALAQQAKWDARYRDSSVQEAQPAFVLRCYAHLLPAQGRALDLASGLGGNALFLAQHGLTTEAWDISSVAVEKLRGFARQRRLTILAQVRDVCVAPPAAASFDVIVVTHFLERRLAPLLVDALRPQGLLFYQTFTTARVDDTGPPAGPYRLGDNELLTLFHDLRLRAYREELLLGDLKEGWRGEALLVGQKAP